MDQKYTKYEKARIIGARALQISMGAPVLVNLDGLDIQDSCDDPIEIATLEMEKGLNPITVKRKKGWTFGNTTREIPV